MSKIHINSALKNEHLVIKLDGELDAITCVTADKEFEKVFPTEAKAVYVDCHNLKYISSAGIGVLISFNHACEEKDVPLFFCEMQPKVKNVLEILGIDKVFNIEPSLELAMEGNHSIDKE